MRVRIIAVLAALAGVGAVVAAGVVLAGGDDAGEVSMPPPVSTASEQPAAEVSGLRAPALAGTDPVSGEAVALADFSGEPVVINVWASWCAPCNDEAPALAQFAERNPDAVLLGIDLQDSRGGARAFYERYGWEHPSIFDPKGEATAKLGLLGLPTTIFLTSDHRESSRIVGPVTLESLEEGYERAAGT
jgi:thiol-disulfide isomerase/thioredoxin